MQSEKNTVTSLSISIAGVCALARTTLKMAETIKVPPDIATESLATFKQMLVMLKAISDDAESAHAVLTSTRLAVIDDTRPLIDPEINDPVDAVALSLIDKFSERIGESVCEFMLGADRKRCINAICEGLMESRFPRLVAKEIDHEEIVGHIDMNELAEECKDSFDYEQIADEIDLNSLAGEINLSDLASEIDARDLSNEFDAKRVADYMDCEDVAQHISAEDVARFVRIPKDSLPDITAEQVAAHIDTHDMICGLYADKDRWGSLCDFVSSDIRNDENFCRSALAQSVAANLKDDNEFLREIDLRCSGSIAERIEAGDPQFFARIGASMAGSVAKMLVEEPQYLHTMSDSIVSAVAVRLLPSRA